MSAFGEKLNPYRKLREPRGIIGIRQSVVITNNPSTIDQNQQLLVRFPNLSSNDVIVPG
jgi:dUTPase